jgi:hypothetical protein
VRRLFIVLIALGLAAVAAYLFVRGVLASDLVRSTLEQQLAARLSQPVRIRGAHAVLFPRLAIELTGLSIGDPASVQLEQVRVLTELRGLFSRVITDAEVRIDGGRMTLPLPFSLGPSASPGPAASSSSAITVASVRVISVRNVVLAAADQSVTVDLESSLAGDRLDVQSLTARAARTTIEAAGAISSLAKLEAAFDATANPFDLDEVIAIGSALGGSGSADGSPAPPMHLTVKIAAPEGRFATYPFRELSTTMDLTAGRLAFVPLSVRAFGGRFEGHLNADTGRGSPQLRLNGRVEDLDVAELIQASGSPGGITGRLSGSLALAGTGRDAVTLLNESRGTITAAVTRGSIPGLDMVRTIVLAFGKPSGAPPEGSGSAFSRLGGSFTLADGLLTSSNLTMESRDFDMAGRGSMRLRTGAIEARADVVLSPELTAQAGTDLRRYAQEDGRVIVPATVTGTLQQPRISLDIAAATRRALGNELKRRATTFIEGLFKKKK